MRHTKITITIAATNPFPNDWFVLVAAATTTEVGADVGEHVPHRFGQCVLSTPVDLSQSEALKSRQKSLSSSTPWHEMGAMVESGAHVLQST
jgi:hypothetical protein